MKFLTPLLLLIQMIFLVAKTFSDVDYGWWFCLSPIIILFVISAIKYSIPNYKNEPNQYGKEQHDFFKGKPSKHEWTNWFDLTDRNN